MVHKKNIIPYILLVVAVSFSFGFLNYKGTINNYRQYTLLINSAQDESYLSNDFYIQQHKGFNIRYFVIQTILLANRFFNNLDIAIPFLYSITIFIISLNMYLLADFYFKDKKFSILASIVAIFLVHFNLGGLALIRPYLDSNMLSSAFILTSLNLLLRGRMVLGYFTLGFAVLFQPIAGLLMYGTFVFVQAAPYAIRLNVKRILINIFESLCFFIIAAINLIPLYITNLRTALPEKNTIIAYTIAIFFDWTNFSPLSWPIERYILYGFFLIIALITSTKYIKKNRHEIYFYAYLAITGIFLVIGVLFVDIWPIAIIAKTGIFRILIFFTTFAYIFIIRHIYLSAIESKYMIEKFFIMIIPIFFFSPVFIKIGLFSMFALVVYEEYRSEIYNILRKLFRNKNYIVLILLILAAAFVFFILKLVIKGAFAQLGSEAFIFRLLFLIFIIAVYLSIFMHLTGMTRRGLLALTVPVLLILMLAAYSFRDISEETACGFLYKPLQHIRQNSDEASLFLVPPTGWSNFRLCANRAVVVDRTSVYTDSAIMEWRSRMLDITKQNDLIAPRDDRKLKIGYHSLTDDGMKSLQKTYKFDYAAFEKEFLAQNYSFPVFYEDEKVIIYKTS